MKLEKDIFELQKERLKKITAPSKPYLYNFLNKEIIVYPNVFYPGTDTELIIKTIKLNGNESVLEPCSGTGVISLFISDKVKKITATDINPSAIENIKANIEKFNLKNIEVIKTDLFPETKEKFDLIIINLPYSDNKARDIVEKSMWDKDHKTTIKFLKKAREYIKENGKIYLSWANFADFNFIEKAAKENNWNIKQISESNGNNYIFRVYELK